MRVSRLSNTLVPVALAVTAGLAAFAWLQPVSAQAAKPRLPPQAAKPRLPPGVDPGGVAVAIAHRFGIDYTRKSTARIMARDGEGELVGWDFVDNDRQPYARAVDGVPQAWGAAVAEFVAREAQRARIIPLRIHAETLTLGRMAAMVGQSGARILLVDLDQQTTLDHWRAFAEAARHFKDVLVVVPAALDANGVHPGTLGVETVLTVAAADAHGRPSGAHSPADVSVAAEPVTFSGADGTEYRWSGAGVAAARVAALAARLVAADPRLTGAALKRRILSLGQPPASSGAPAPPWIDAPERAEALRQ